MDSGVIHEIVDRHIAWFVQNDLNNRPVKVMDPEMSDPRQDPAEESRIWLPIPSKVSDIEIKEFEELIGHKLPESYKVFLKYKHFYEILVDQAQFEHLVNTWRLRHAQMIYEGYPRDWLIDKGYIPFAVWSDWGMLCFDTNSPAPDYDYPIVLWDHEVWDSFQRKSNNFLELMIELDKVSQTKV